MFTNPALFASLFVVSVTRVHVDGVDTTADHPGQPAEDHVDVGLSDGSSHRFLSFVETGEDPTTHAPTYRVGLVTGEHELVEGPVVNESHRGMFATAGIELPDLSPIVPEPPAGPTEEEIAAHRELVQKGIDVAAEIAAAALAASHPGVAAAIEAITPIVDKIPTQQHYERLDSLMQIAVAQLPAAYSWVAREMHAIHIDLRPRTTE